MPASADHDGYLYCTQVTTDGSPNAFVSSCQATSFQLSDPGQKDNGTFVAIGGGTSFAAPDFAGLLAIIEQKLGVSSGLGNINPTLYTLAANATTYASAFHDITTGNNQVPCTPGSPDCPTGSNPVIGYVAGTGYDQTTGIGSVNATNLATAFAALVTATGTKTTLTAAPGTSLEINEAVTFTATVAPNTLSTAPTGTVTFTVDGVAQAPVTLSTAAPYIGHIQDRFCHCRDAHRSGDLLLGRCHVHGVDQHTRDDHGRCVGNSGDYHCSHCQPDNLSVGVRRDADGDGLGNNGGHAHRSGYLHDGSRSDHRQGQSGDAGVGQYRNGDLECCRRDDIAGLRSGYGHHHGYLWGR